MKQTFRLSGWLAEHPVKCLAKGPDLGAFILGGKLGILNLAMLPGGKGSMMCIMTCHGMQHIRVCIPCRHSREV